MLDELGFVVDKQAAFARRLSTTKRSLQRLFLNMRRYLRSI